MNTSLVFDHRVSLVLASFALPIDSHHGPIHWARVLENGMRLAPLTGADPVVVSLFAIFHDACRLNDGSDVFHGPRAAKWVKGIDLGITSSQKGLLIDACAGHTNKLHSVDSTVATCWDADRLDIARVGIIVNSKFMSTQAARDPAILAWAQERAEYGRVPDFATEFL